MDEIFFLKPVMMMFCKIRRTSTKNRAYSVGEHGHRRATFVLAHRHRHSMLLNSCEQPRSYCGGKLKLELAMPGCFAHMLPSLF